MAKNLNTTVASSINEAPAKTKRVRAPKKAAASGAMAVQHVESVQVDDLEMLLADLGGSSVDKIIEAATGKPSDEVIEVTDEQMAAAVSSAEATELMIAAATPDGVVDGATPVLGEIATDATIADASAEAATDEAGAAKTRAPRKHYADKVERLKDRMGASLSEYAVLTTEDALDDAAVSAAMTKTLEIIHAMNSKEKNRAGNFMEFIAGKRAKLNNVLDRVLKTLDRDGFLTTGNEGNVFKDLIARPYSPASARAMGGNTVSMFADLKVIVADGKGRFIANPDSLLLMKAQSMLAAAPAATTEAEPEAEATEDLAAELEGAPAA